VDDSSRKNLLFPVGDRGPPELKESLASLRLGPDREVLEVLVLNEPNWPEIDVFRPPPATFALLSFAAAWGGFNSEFTDVVNAYNA
jgi:hypothetical protein